MIESGAQFALGGLLSTKRCLGRRAFRKTHTSKLDLGREDGTGPPAAYHRETFLRTTNPTICIKGSMCRLKKKMDLLSQAVSFQSEQKLASVARPHTEVHMR
jgi:hypothetical protein